MDESTTVQDTMSTPYVGQNTSLSTGCIQVRHDESGYLPWDNPYNIVTREIEAYAINIKDITLTFCFLIGGPANVVNMAVFCKQGLQDRVNLCLFMLAVFDDMYLTTAVFVHSPNIYSIFSGRAVPTPENVFMTNNNLVVFIGSAFVSLSLSAIIACERCYCVLRPLRYQTLLRTRTMAVIIVAVCLCVFSLYFIVAYRYHIGCLHDPVTGATLMKITGGDFYRTHQQLVDYLDSIFFGAGVPGGMMVVVVAATITTSVKLRQIVTWRTETSSSSLSPREVALTKMLIGSSVFFIVCTSPACVFRVACLFLPEMNTTGRHHNFYFTTLWILEGFVFINASFNFFIYCAMGSRYRETLRELFNNNKKH